MEIVQCECFRCYAVFHDLKDLKNHFIHVHEILSREQHNCARCNKVYANRTDLLAHLRKSLCGHFREMNDHRAHRRQHAVSVEITKEQPKDIISSQELSLNEDNEGVENLADVRIDVDNPSTETLKSTCQEFTIELKEHWLALICDICAKRGVSRKAAFEIFSESKEVLFDCVISFISTFFAKFFLSIEIYKIFQNMCDDINQNYKKFNTEYKYGKQLNLYNVYKDPVEIQLEEIVQSRRHGDQLTTNSTMEDIVVPNLSFKLKLFMELPGVYESIVAYQEKVSKSSKICNIINGEVWRELTANKGNKVEVPVLLFYDDFVIDNAISYKTKKTSIAGFYLMFPSIPPEYRSKVENILTAAVFRTMEVNKYGYEKCLNPMIDEFLLLEEKGLEISIDGSIKKVYFFLIQTTGDNKGLNEILMYTRSFIGKRHCRICEEEKTVMQRACHENSEKIRTREKYYTALQANNEKETGIRGVCALDKLKSFKAYNNYVVDIHHDLLEGDCHFVVCNVLRYYIENKFITFARLNSIRKHFIAESCGRNISDIEIKYEHLEKEKLHFNASEMKQFTLFLPLMLNHIIENKSNDHWKILLLLVEILEISLLPEFDQETLTHMDKLIEEHHDIFIRIFRNLRFKQHAMLHYSRAIRKVGPLCNISAMRGESKHQSLKRIAESTSSRKNLPRSIIISENYALASRSLKKEGFGNGIEWGKTKKIGPEMLDMLNKIGHRINDCDNAKTAKYLSYYGIKFREGYGLYEKTGNVIKLYKILNIVLDGNIMLFLCITMVGFQYKENLRCFIKEGNIQPSCHPDVQYKIINVFDVQYKPSLFINMPSGDIALKFYKKLEIL